jgi:hypothetical protein
MIDATNRTHHYARTLGSSPERLPQRIEAAYVAAGLTPPARRSAVDVALDAEPAPDDLARDLAAEALQVTDGDAAGWLEDALDRMQRTHAAHTLRLALAKWTPNAVRDARVDLTRGALDELAPAFTRAVDTLTKAAQELPTPDPFDMAAIIATDATRAAREAGQALTLLGRLADVHGTVQAAQVGPNTAALLPVVTLPAVTVEDVDRLSRSPLDSTDPDRTHRTAVRRLIDHATRHGCDRALVDVARGAYGEAVRLELAATPAELDDRLERAETAMNRRVVDSWGYKGKRATVRT